MIQADVADRRLLNLLQAEFPFTREPFAGLGKRLDVTAEDVIRRIACLKEEGIIRLIGPVMEPRSLGYRTTLAAMSIPESRLVEAEQAIAGHPGVSHGYERDHRFNVWCTLAVPHAADMEVEVARLSSSAGAEAAFSLPTVKMFKIGVFFDMEGNGKSVPAARSMPAGQAALSESDRMVVNTLQQDLPLIRMPFDALADNAGMGADAFVGACRSLLERGVIRRYGASIKHIKAGFSANAMSCWAVSADRAETVGSMLAACREVSHCYERKTNPQWRYNLFAMIHGHSRDECEAVARKVSEETGLADYIMLYSTREFKKQRLKYPV